MTPLKPQADNRRRACLRPAPTRSLLLALTLGGCLLTGLAPAAVQGATGPADTKPAAGNRQDSGKKPPAKAQDNKTGSKTTKIGPASAPAPTSKQAASRPQAGTTALAERKAVGKKVGLSPNMATLPSYQNREVVRQFARDVAQRNQLDEGQVLGALQQARYQPAVARAIVPPSQPGARNWQKYRNNHVDSMRLKAGLKFWDMHEYTLRQAEDRYGVPAEIIVAIIGIETIFGRQTGNFRTIDALSTLAFDYPPAPRNRSEFFRGELESLFVLARETGLDPLEVKGSFAGAIGMGQFMPSSWRRFAVDGNNDGEIDLFHSSADTIASVGNFLKVHGWQRNGFWYSNAMIANDDDSLRFANQMVADGIIPRLTRQQLQDKGISAASSQLGELPGENDLLCLIDLPTGLENTEYRLGSRNFYAVTRYNRSNFYGMSVMELAQNLRLGWDERKLLHAEAVKRNATQPEPVN
jgi:membrane-bound lytic murein transglycosylase B